MFEKLYLELCTISIFHSVTVSSAVSGFKKLLELFGQNEPNTGEMLETYSLICSSLIEEKCLSLGDYIEKTIKYSPSSYAVAAAKGNTDAALEAQARAEYTIFEELASLRCDSITKKMLENCPDIELYEWQNSTIIDFDTLSDFYRENGYGEFAKSHALTWDGKKLTAIPCDDIRGSGEMFGYDWQRKEVYDNTLALVNGCRVNNVLLFGDSGTGKSAAVKSMVNFPEFGRLRLIEADKRQLDSLPGLMLSLRDIPLKFIIFIDDLSFQDGDPNYSALKIILEGGVAQRPENVAIYATSNRRQLVKRNFSDRDDMDKTETVQEKTSLADRFGIRIPYMALDRPEFMKLVSQLTEAEKIKIEPDELYRLALRWEMEHAARTPRVAVQFVDWLRGQKSI